MRLKDLGERRVLNDIIFKYLDREENILGIDEDAVAYKLPDGQFLVVNVDTFVKSTDAPPLMTFYYMGVKTVIMTLSDLMAKGAIPKYFLLSASLPSDLKVEDLEQILSGVKDTCYKFNVKFSGGDLGSAPDVILTGIGIGYARRLLNRSSAEPGDYVWVTGYFGLTGAALHYLLKQGRVLNKKVLNKIIDYFLNPPICLNDGLAVSSVAKAAMDSSDGLAITLWTIAKQSKVKIVIEKLPLTREVIKYALWNNLDPRDLVFYGGEEFEIVFTSSLPEEEIINNFKKLGARIPIRIGVVEEGSGVFFNGKLLENKGWEHLTT